MSTRVNNTKVIISARASYLHAFEPDSINGSDPKYSVSLIIDKKDTDLIAKIKKAVEQAKEDGKSKWFLIYRTGEHQEEETYKVPFHKEKQYTPVDWRRLCND